MSDARSSNSSQQTRLIREYENYDAESLTDHLLILAKDIENALLAAGAQPGTDYTYETVFSLAVRYHPPSNLVPNNS